MSASPAFGLCYRPTPPVGKSIGFEFRNVKFEDGATLTGTIRFNTALTEVYSFNIVTSPGYIEYTGTYPGASYNDISASSCRLTDGKYLLINNLFSSPETGLDLTFVAPLTINGATFGPNSLEFSFPDVRRIVSGETVNPALPAVPEPATWALMIAGFTAVGLTLRRRCPAIA